MGEEVASETIVFIKGETFGVTEVDTCPRGAFSWIAFYHGAVISEKDIALAKSSSYVIVGEDATVFIRAII